MRKFKIIFSLVCCLCMLFAVGCGSMSVNLSPNNQISKNDNNNGNGSNKHDNNNGNNNSTSNGNNNNGSSNKNPETKDYYIKQGYIDINISSDFEVSGDIKTFSDGSVFAKSRTNISLSFVAPGFVKNNNRFFNTSTKQILTGISVNGEISPASSFDCDNIKIMNSTTILPVYSSFAEVGVAVFVNLNDLSPEELDSTVFETDAKLFEREDLFFCKTETLESAQSESDFDTNATFLFNRDSQNLNFTFELPVEFVCKVFMILKISETEFYLYEIGGANDVFSTNLTLGEKEYATNIDFSEDISTKPLR